MSAAPARRTGPILGALCAAILSTSAARAGDLGAALSADQGRAVAADVVSACAADKACSAASTTEDPPQGAAPSLRGDGDGHVVWDDGRTRVRVGGRTRVDFSVFR